MSINKNSNQTVEPSRPNHLLHAVLLIALWLPVLVIELYLFKDSNGLSVAILSSEDKSLLLAVFIASIVILATAIWKFFLYFKQPEK